MVMSASYGGNLKAYLSTPSFTEPIDSLEQIDSSGYGLDILLGGEEEEKMMETSTDPLMMRIWGKLNQMWPNYEFVALPDVKLYLVVACFLFLNMCL